jgi:hypothetical protein
VAGKIASGRAFNGGGNIVDLGSNASVDNIFSGGGTVETWFLATSWGQNGLGRIFDKGPSNVSYAMCDANVQAAFLFGKTFNNGAGNWCTPANSLSLNTWTHVAVIYDDGSTSNVPAIYINGVARTVTATSNPSGSSTSDASAVLTMGERTSGGRSFAGSIDEPRWSTTARSDGWIRTTYENQRDPAAFYVIAP